MAWLTEKEFRRIYVTESATDIPPDQISQSLDEAKDIIGGLCGNAVLDEIEAFTIADAESAAEIRRYKDFKRAEGKLAFRELLLIMSSRFRSGGIRNAERDENTGSTNQFERFSETENRRDVLYADALRILKPYLTVESVSQTATVSQGYSSRVKVVSDW